MRHELVVALEAERDAALEDATFQRERAERAASRLADVRGEADELRRRVRELIASEQRHASRAEAAEHTLARRRGDGSEAELTEQLCIALDSARRLQREGERLRSRFTETRAQRDALEGECERLRARVQALEGAQRMAART